MATRRPGLPLTCSVQVAERDEGLLRQAARRGGRSSIHAQDYFPPHATSVGDRDTDLLTQA